MKRLLPRPINLLLVLALVMVGAVTMIARPLPAQAAKAPDTTPAMPTITMRVEVPAEELDRIRAEARDRGPAARLVPKPEYVERTTVSHDAQEPLSLLRASQLSAQHASTYGQATASTPETLVEAAAAPAPIGEDPPPALLAECFNAGGADQGIGRIHNRFTYCQRVRITVQYYSISPNRPPEHEGDTHATLEVFAQGDNHDRRIRVFARIQEGSVDHDWGPWDNFWTAPNVRLSMLGQCAESFQVCGGTGGAPTMPWVSWDNQSDWFHWDIIDKEINALGRDRITAIRWYVEFFTDDPPYKTIVRGKTADRVLRCDSATYFNRPNAGNEPRACVFAEIRSRLTYQLGSNAHAVADHILRAQKTPNETYPRLVPAGTPPPRDKRVPGQYIAEDPLAPGLHRITPTLHPGEYKDNRDHKDGACYKTGPHKDVYWDTGLPNPPVSGQQCDEYPFASTLEGAAHPHWDFSVQAVPERDNSSAGGKLVRHYLDDRVLAWDFDLPSPGETNDQFFVEITAPCGDCGGGGGPGPPGNAAPKVDAGPDVSGSEGPGIALNGTVTDPDDTPDVSWSYRLGANTDPGMTCRFSSPNQAKTTIRCTDDGTVTVTLAADDHHHGGPVTDTATVTITNAAPAVKIDSPAPDQLFNGREPTPVMAGFTDPGSNDTHTCTITFGDGSPPVRGTVQEQAGTGTCTGSHTYGYDGLGPRTITVTIEDDDGAAASASVRVVIYVPGAGFGVQATGLVAVPRSPDVRCPPSASQSIATLSIPLLGSIKGINVACTLDPQHGRTVADTTVSDVSVLAGAVRITGIESHCTAGAEGISRTSRVGTINGIPIGTGKGSLAIAGVATVHYNETSTNERGQLVQNAVRISTPLQEIIIANCTLG